MADPVDAVFDTVARTATDVRDALGDRRSYAEGENPSGEQQLAADVYADRLLEERLLAIEAVGSYASEERADVIEDDGSLHVVADPLDGSSNLASNNAMGTIVGVYESPPPAPGSAMVAACYVLYGPITTMVSARDGAATEELIEDGSRRVLESDVSIPGDSTVYGFGGRVPDWPERFQAFVDEVEADRLKLRYGGAMVADVNQVLSYGGLFGYPMLVDSPEGKLRLQFEGHPMAYVLEAAGGRSSNGTRSLLSLAPEDLHERTPLFLGNGSLVDRLEATL